MRGNRGTLGRALVAGLVIALGTVAGSNLASADQIQVQSYQRASRDQVCTAQPGETAWQASWGVDASWHPTWEQWANSGSGGWTCTRTITWARDAAADVPRVYQLGDIGPGGGVVFFVDLTRPAGSQYMEMAPKTWSGVTDPSYTWCDGIPLVIAGASGTAVGTGSANTVAMAASGACSSNAAAAVLAYGGNDSSVGQWYLPSKGELNLMCNFAHPWVGSPPAPSAGACFGNQDSAFASGAYGFETSQYWSSSQYDQYAAWNMAIGTMYLTYSFLDLPNVRVRPIRTF